MKITNKFNLPEIFVKAFSRKDYSKGKSHLSVTELINSPRIVQLRNKHWDQLEEDVSDGVWRGWGTGMHKYLEDMNDSSNHITEQRLHINFDGVDISGAIDDQEITNDGIIISDYKVTSVWAVMNDKPEWEQQLNMYAWVVEKVKRVPVIKTQIYALLRDWSRREAMYKTDYPQCQIAVVEIPLWDFDEREEYIRKRVHIHSEAFLSNELGDELPQCTPAEMWEKKTTYAVKKKGGKRAVNVFTSKEESAKRLEELGIEYEVEVRKGERTRCANFCPVSEFCTQYKDYLNQESNNG